MSTGDTISTMSLKHSNPYLKSAAARKAGLRMSARTSSAVEGIRAPFQKDKGQQEPTTEAEFIAYWKKRVASRAR